MNIGDRVAFLRKRKNLTQAQLAAISGTSQQGIARLESNKSKKSQILPDVAKALDIDYGFLVSDSFDASESAIKASSERYSLVEVMEAVEQSIVDSFRAVDNLSKTSNESVVNNKELLRDLIAAGVRGKLTGDYLSQITKIYSHGKLNQSA